MKLQGKILIEFLNTGVKVNKTKLEKCNTFFFKIRDRLACGCFQ